MEKRISPLRSQLTALQYVGDSPNDLRNMAAIIKLPIHCLERIFKYLSWEDLIHCSAVCTEWNSILSDGNILCWDIASARFLPAESRVFDLIRGLSHKERIIAFACAWTKNTISGNMYILGNHFTVHRRPIPNSSDAARASVGFTCGVHRWVVRFESPRLGSHSGVGICTSSASLHGKDYYFVIGEDGESWGWDVVRHDLKHDGKTVGKIVNEVCQ